MPVAREKLHKLGRAGLILANVVVALVLLATAALIVLEGGWAKPTFRANEEAFQHGTIGTELMPLALALVLPDLFPENFLPGGKQAGDWIDQFGFIRNDDPKVNEGLPVGFAVSRYRPLSGSPSPAAFVGFSCALCHSTVIRTDADQHGKIFYGPGSNSLNLFAWLDAFQASMLVREPLPTGTSFDPDDPPRYRLTSSGIVDAYEAKTRRKLGLLERGMIALWLRQIRARLADGLPRFDEPFGQGRSRDPQVTPTGPTRTQPFRTLIRTVFDRPGNDMPVYTKIATVFSEGLRKHSQFDGSIANLHARSSLAALAAGATVENMSLPEIADNIRKASDYTVTLRPPRYADLFPQQPPAAAARLARGGEVYRQHCYECHGDRDPASGSWQNGPKVGEIVPLGIIRTDPERVMFRHYGDMGNRLFQVFPEKHPFHFPRDEISPRPGEEENLAIRGYVNAPMDGMFLRAPFLHNASVLTLAELINLKKRRDVFYRGHNRYDPIDAGYRSPDAPDGETYFKFDTSIRGNSNKGHDFPWTYDDPNRNVDDLTVLLDYLKTL